MASNNKAVVAAGLGVGLLAMLTLRKSEGSAMTPKKPVSSNQAKAVTLAVKYSAVFGGPPSLLIAIMQIESNNRFDAINMKNARGGAWGICQMTLDTAKDLTKRFQTVAKKYWPRFDGTGQSLLDPETNVALAAFQVGLLWKAFKAKPNNWLVAGLAYHQGSGTISKLLAAGNGRLVPTQIPPNGKIYYAGLQKQQTGNPVVAKAINNERGSGFAYV